MHWSVLGTHSDAALGDNLVVSSVAGACFGTHLAQHDLERVCLIYYLLLLLLVLLLLLCCRCASGDTSAGPAEEDAVCQLDAPCQSAQVQAVTPHSSSWSQIRSTPHSPSSSAHLPLRYLPGCCTRPSAAYLVGPCIFPSAYFVAHTSPPSANLTGPYAFPSAYFAASYASPSVQRCKS